MRQVAILVQEHHIHSARSVVLGIAKVAVFAFGCSFQPVAEVFADSVVVLQPAAASRIWGVGRASLPTAAELITHCAVCLWYSMRVGVCSLEVEKFSIFKFKFVIYASMFTRKRDRKICL